MVVAEIGPDETVPAQSLKASKADITAETAPRFDAGLHHADSLAA